MIKQLPSEQLLNQIKDFLLYSPNQKREQKRKVHYCLFLLGWKAGLRVSEAVSFDLTAKTSQGLYRITKTKGKKERYAAIPKQVISELKKYNWQPNSTNRWNFYHFLKKIRNKLAIPPNLALTPHTLRHSFATYHAENGLPLPLLSKMLGHSSVRTTALYWQNIYHGDDDDSDNSIILVGKEWLEKQEETETEPPTSEISPYPEPLSSLTENWQVEQQTNYSLSTELSNYQQKLAERGKKIANLQTDLVDLSEQNATLLQEKSQFFIQKHQIQHDLGERNKMIADWQEQLKITQENNQLLRVNNANLSQELAQRDKIIAELQKSLNKKSQTETQLSSQQVQNHSYQSLIQQKDQAISHLKQENLQLIIHLKRVELAQLLNSHLTKNLPNLAQQLVKIQLTKSEIQDILAKQAEIKQLEQISNQEQQFKAQIQVNCWKPKP